MSIEKVDVSKLGQGYKCSSCGGIYYPHQNGGYYHTCPDGTAFPRNENIDPENPEKQIKGKARDKGGAVKYTEMIEP